jgi:hypothetical protein
MSTTAPTAIINNTITIDTTAGINGDDEGGIAVVSDGVVDIDCDVVLTNDSSIVVVVKQT